MTSTVPVTKSVSLILIVIITNHHLGTIRIKEANRKILSTGIGDSTSTDISQKHGDKFQLFQHLETILNYQITLV